MDIRTGYKMNDQETTYRNVFEKLKQNMQTKIISEAVMEVIQNNT